MTERLYETGAPLLEPADAKFEARVLSCAKRGEHTAVVLDRTLFFPEGGGQPCDLGLLGGRRVLDVAEDGEAVVHLVEGGPLSGEVVGEVDLRRRRDHMEQHSGQHLLSAVLLRHGVETRSFHLGNEVTIDVPERGVGPELLARAEAEVNQAIRDGLPVVASLHVGQEARAAAADLRKPPTEAALNAPRGLRIVTFGPEDDPLDRDPCCGTHVDHTGRLGSLVILGCERGRKGELRIQFAVGGRAVEAARSRLDALGQTTEVLTTGFRELPERAEKLLGQVKQLSRELKRARQAALTLEAEAAAQTCDGPVVTRAFSEGEPGQLRAWANAFLARRPAASLVLSHRRPGEERVSLAVARGAEAPESPGAQEVLRAALTDLGGKGGGNARFAQGSAAAAHAPVTAAVARAAEALSGP